MKVPRTAKITYKILEGREILETGHENARKLWNYTRWCLFGYNEKLRIERGDSWEVYKRNLPYARGEKYLGKFTFIKELKDYWAAKELSDRCFSYTIADFDIAMRSWFSNVRNNPKARPPRYSKEPRILTFELGKNVKSLGNWTYKLTVLGSCIKDRHAIIKLNIKPGIKMADIKMLKLQPDGTGSVIYYIETEETKGDKIAAIDLGVINIVTLAFDNGESILVSGKGLLASNQWYQKQAANCKPKEWYKGKAESRQSENFKQYRRKAGNIQKLAVHNLTRFIIDECIKRNVSKIVIGDLTGIRDNADYSKSTNQKLHNWPFAEISRQLKYKAEEKGLEVFARSERNTSKLHHLTKEKGIRNPRGLVTFKEAKQVINSDVNGAFGILNNYLEEIGQDKVSPAKVGVEAILPSLSSLSETAKGIGKVQSFLQIEPTFVAKFDLRNWSIVQTSCNTIARAELTNCY